MFYKISLFLFFCLLPTAFCIENARILALAYKLAAQFPQAPLNSIDIQQSQKMQEIIRNSARPVTRRLNDIKAIAIPFARKQGKDSELTISDDKLWNHQVNQFKDLIDKNDRFVKRLLMSDITDEVKLLDDEIQELYSKIEMYKNGRAYVVKTLQSILSKTPEPAFTKWEQIYAEIYEDGHSFAAKSIGTSQNTQSHIDRNKLIEHYAINFYNRNSMVMPDVIDFVNKELNIMNLQQKSINERMDLLKNNYFEMKEAMTGQKKTHAEMEEEWKTVSKEKLPWLNLVNGINQRFEMRSNSVKQLNRDILRVQTSRQLYNVKSKEEAVNMLKNALTYYSDADLATWEMTYEGRNKSNFESSNG